jgi:hypothetical protein
MSLHNLQILPRRSFHRRLLQQIAGMQTDLITDTIPA